MSTMTLRKRIALVAVSALGAGLLSVVTVPSANAATGDITFSATLANALPQSGQTAGVCAIGLGTAASPEYIAVGGSQTVTGAVETSLVSGANFVIAGPAVWSGAASGGNVTSTTSSDRKTLTQTATAAGTAFTGVMSITGTGPITVTASDATGTSTAAQTKYLVGVTSCTGGPVIGKSYVAVQASYAGNLATNVDASAGLSTAYAAAGQYSYINFTLNDTYGAVLTSGGLTGHSITASSTGGCNVGFGSGTAGVTTGAPLAVAANGANTYKFGVTVIGDNTPRVCVVTINYDGSAFATKTITMLGDVAAIKINTVVSSTNVKKSTAATNAFCYNTYDSAGNLVTPTYGNLSYSGTGSALGAALADGTTQNAAAMGTYGYACVTPTAAALNGAGTYTLSYTNNSLVKVTSGVASVVVANSDTYSFKVGWDKASYNLGDIAVLTISPLDDKGNAIYDGKALTGLVVSVGGATQLGTAYSAADTTTGGVKTYSYAIGTLEGQFAYSVALTSTTGQSALTGTYKAASSSTTVTNAQVLASIVSLIASINKQIVALQKLILKKK